ncbi:hypothetical protein C8T65DRAFT_739060 [Cerioporus squamosus]|nr:hypothetical protein C8T65DRAFT_739060 [Cerioporus squamosus]
MATYGPELGVPPEFPSFTGSQLLRALLLPSIPTKTRASISASNVSTGLSAGHRMMTFGPTDPNEADEQRLIEQLRGMMYPHGLPRAHAPALPGAGTSSGTDADVASPEESSVSGDPVPEEVRAAHNLPYVDTVAAPPAAAPVRPRVGPFSPEWDPKEPWIAEPSDSTKWFVVTVGRRIGVFDNPTERDSAVNGCPGNSSSMVSSRSAAVARFNLALGIPDYVRVVL